MKNNCIDNDCKHMHTVDHENYICDVLNVEMADVDDLKDCSHFEPRQCCDDCIHSKREVYETGTIDEIDYFCKLQDNKLIYKDISFDWYDKSWPECNINKFTSKRDM